MSIGVEVDPFAYRSPDLPEHVRHGTLRAENGNVLLAPWDRKYGALLLGLPGVGKTALALAMYLNDIWDPDATIIAIDFKSELAGFRSPRSTTPDVRVSATSYPPPKCSTSSRTSSARPRYRARWTERCSRP